MSERGWIVIRRCTGIYDGEVWARAGFDPRSDEGVRRMSAGLWYVPGPREYSVAGFDAWAREWFGVDAQVRLNREYLRVWDSTICPEGDLFWSDGVDDDEGNCLNIIVNSMPAADVAILKRRRFGS